MTSPRLLLGSCLTFCLIAAAPPAASSQPTGIETFLEQRVVEELAADGIVLSRLKLVLDVELIDTRALVSLIDPDTGRAVASTKVDAMPADRETAVATLGPVVANLVAQFAGRQPDPSGSASIDTARLERIEETQKELLVREQQQREERARLDRAEAQYREEALRFDREIAMVTANDLGNGFAMGQVHYKWTATRGETAVPLGDLDYYRVIERPDLEAAYKRRRKIANTTALASLGLLVGGIVLAVHRPDVEADYRGCNTGDQFNDQWCRTEADWAAEDARDDKAKPWQAAGGIALLGSGVALGVSMYYYMRPHPITEGEARRLGAEHNRKVRQRLGLPTSEAPVSVTWAPYVSADGGGVALSGRF